MFLACGCLLTHLHSFALVCTHVHTSCMASRMAGSASRVEALRGPRNNVRSSGVGESRLGYGRVTESLDERALSSASTPVHNMPGAGKSSMTAGRHAMGQVSYDAGDKLLTDLPRRYSNAGTGSMAKGPSGGTNAYDRVWRLLGSKASPGARDENEAPNNGAPLSIFGVTPPRNHRAIKRSRPTIPAFRPQISVTFFSSLWHAILPRMLAPRVADSSPINSSARIPAWGMRVGLSPGARLVTPAFLTDPQASARGLLRRASQRRG
jgi:hypothetical protein